MKNLITGFSKQLSEALQFGLKSGLSEINENISNVAICGMGGSGIAGTITRDIIASECPVPVTIINDYFLPGYVNENSLVIICSYSGDTEETLQAFDAARKKQSVIYTITSGGSLALKAVEYEIPVMLIPAGLPPRAAVAYSTTQMLFILYRCGFISGKFIKDLEEAITVIDEEELNIRREAKEIAFQLQDKITIIYGTSAMESVCVRFRQQLNENAKALCWHHVFPELNHNEIQGWRDKNENLVVVIFRNDNDYFRTAKRIEFTKEVLQHYDAEIIDVYSKGDTLIERMMYLIHFGDWVSYYTAEIKGVDTMDIRVIKELKAELEKI